MRVAQEKSPLSYAAVLYILGFLLFLEWLYPVKEMMQTTQMTVFVLYALFCFSVTFLQVKWWISFLLKGMGVFLIVNHLFFEEAMFSTLWLEHIFTEITLNVQAIVQQQWYDVTLIFQVGLFLLLIWFMSYLIYHWFVGMNHAFLFVILTFIYLAILDTFTTYDAGGAVIRTFIISLLALGISNFMSEFKKQALGNTSFQKKLPLLLALVFFVSFSAMIGYAAPKLDAKWPDPISYVKEMTGQGSGHSTSQKGGYREDDSMLGGSLEQDDTVVFQAIAKKSHYWRIETKDVYTGKGWEYSHTPTYDQQVDGHIDMETFSKYVEKEELKAVLNINEKTSLQKLLYPYGITSVKVESGSDLIQFYLDERSESIRPQINNQDVALNHYMMTYDHPSYDVHALRNVSSKDPEAIVNRYTQLPTQLPERVAQLADELAGHIDNRFDQAKAIENYFHTDEHGFVYQLSDVPIPQDNEDYVDQFLFDTKAGYCDNYSTSMVVMLRTLDIPARWVKGFTSGEKKAEQVSRADDIYNVYEVTNKNAHSWVEVYFPEIGWIPFEPTKGFSNDADFHKSTDVQGDEDSLEIPSVDVENEQAEHRATNDQSEEIVEDETTATAEVEPASTFKVEKWHMVLAVTSLALILVVLFKNRFSIGMSLSVRRMKRQLDAESFQNAYHYLLKLLKHKGYEKPSGITLREYATKIDQLYATTSMKRLTLYYEQLIYNNHAEEGTISTEAIGLWKKLMKTILN